MNTCTLLKLFYFPYCNDVTTAYSNTKNVKKHKRYVHVAVIWTHYKLLAIGSSDDKELVVVPQQPLSQATRKMSRKKKKLQLSPASICNPETDLESGRWAQWCQLPKTLLPHETLRCPPLVEGR